MDSGGGRAASGRSVEGGTFVVLGRVLGAYGVKGWLRIQPYGDDPLSWGTLDRWWFAFDTGVGAGATAELRWQPRRQLNCRLHGGVLLAQLEDVVERDAAEALAGALMAIPREALPATRSDEYYWGDLQGMRVRNAAEDDLGVVSGLIETGANDVLVVSAPDGRERLLPFVATVVVAVDRDRDEIRVDWGKDW